MIYIDFYTITPLKYKIDNNQGTKGRKNDRLMMDSDSKQYFCVKKSNASTNWSCKIVFKPWNITRLLVASNFM